MSVLAMKFIVKERLGRQKAGDIDGAAQQRNNEFAARQAALCQAKPKRPVRRPQNISGCRTCPSEPQDPQTAAATSRTRRGRWMVRGAPAMGNTSAATVAPTSLAAVAPAQHQAQKFSLRLVPAFAGLSAGFKCDGNFHKLPCMHRMLQSVTCAASAGAHNKSLAIKSTPCMEEGLLQRIRVPLPNACLISCYLI